MLPPVPLVLSKLKYHIRSRYKDDPELENVLKKLGPYYTFRICATFRSLENGLNVEYTDIASYIESETIEWDCIDTALNMFTRLKTKLRESIQSPGVLRVSIEHREEGSPVDARFFDLYVDEQPLNIRGIVDSEGKDITFYPPSKQ